MKAGMQHVWEKADLRRPARAGATSAHAAAASPVSHVTIARMMKYGLLPGSAVVVLGLSAPGFPLGAGDVIDRAQASGAISGAVDTTEPQAGLRAWRVTVPIRSAVPRSARAPIEWRSGTSALSMPLAAMSRSIVSQPALTISPLAIDIEIQTVDLAIETGGQARAALPGDAPDRESAASAYTTALVRAPIAGRAAAFQDLQVEALAPPGPALFIPDLGEIAPVAVSAESVAAIVIPSADAFPMPQQGPMPQQDPITGPSVTLAAEEIGPIARVQVAPVVGLAVGPVGSLQAPAALAPPIVRTIDLLPVGNTIAVQSASISDSRPVVSLSAPKAATNEPARMAAIPAARETPGLADAMPQQVLPVSSVPVRTDPVPAERASLARIVDPIRPATLPSSTSSSAFAPDIGSQMLTRIDGQLAGKLDFQQIDQSLSVRLGSIVELLKDRYDVSEFAQITSSSASDTFLTIRQLRDAGIPISYDPVYDEFNVGSRDHRPAAAHKVQIDQISTPEYAPGPAGMEQIRR